MKKRLLSLALVASMVLGLGLTAGCGNSGGSKDTGSTSEPKKTSSVGSVDLMICHIASEQDPIHEGWTYFAK